MTGIPVAADLKRVPRAVPATVPSRGPAFGRTVPVPRATGAENVLGISANTHQTLQLTGGSQGRRCPS